MRLIVTRGCIEIKMAAKTPFELGEFNSNKGCIEMRAVRA